MRESRRHVLRYDEKLGGDNVWRVAKDAKELVQGQNGVEINATIGGIQYKNVVVALRWKKLTRRSTFIAPADTDRTLWITQPVVLVADLLPVELQLERAPLSVAETLSDW